MTHAKKTVIHKSMNEMKSDDGKSNEKKNASDKTMLEKWQSKEKGYQHEQEVVK